MSKLWKVISNYKLILDVIKKIAEAAKDKVITEEELRPILDETIQLAKVLDLVK